MLWIKLLTWFKGELVGADCFGNQYYREKGPESLKERRWVIYKGIAEASKVSAEWHGWLHHMTLNPPTLEQRQRWPWEKNHLPNLSGTSYAYRPLGWNGKRNTVTGNYQAWDPHKVNDENKST
jgi:NADH:ubiquinone oxidoreductase subunit